MGAWDYGALDSDAAQDMLEAWNEFEDCPTAERVSEILDDIGDAIRYGDSITNMRIIALSAIVRGTGEPIPERLLQATIDAINRELVEDELSSWDNPALREKTLLEMLTDLGGKRQQPETPSEYLDASIQFSNTESAHAELMRLHALAYAGGYLGLHDLMSSRPEWMDEEELFDQPHELAPSFIRALHRLMERGIAEKDSNLWDQARRERRMMLAWYLGVTSIMPPEEMDQLLKRVEGKGF